MNKVLMIVYSWPPRAGVGMIRPLKFAKYLLEFGWEPTILTPKNAPSQIYCREKEGHLSGVRVISTGYCDILTSVKKKLRLNPQRTMRTEQVNENINKSSLRKKIISSLAFLLKEFLTIPDENIGWYRPAIRKGKELLKDEKFNIIYSTSPPESSHLIAKKLKKISGLPWIADLRDPWSEYHHFTNTFRLKNSLNKRLEKKTLIHSDYLITVTAAWAKRFKKLYKQNISAITNGFDEEDFQTIDKNNNSINHKFTIIYTGKIHRIYQNPELLFFSIHELIEERRINPFDISIKFFTFGNNLPNFSEIKKKYCLDDILSCYPPLEYKKSLTELKKSHLTFIVDWEGNDEISRGVLPAKLFDYLGAKRPILTISSKKDSDLCKIVRETSAGHICSTKDEIKQAILDYYMAFKENKLRYAPNEKMIKKYSRLNLTKQFAEILYRINN